MENEESQTDHTITEEEQDHIRTVFHEKVVPKLVKLHARLGNIACEFAGERYKNWMIEFKSVGDDFEIVDFEYDEKGAGIDLDL